MKRFLLAGCLALSSLSLIAFSTQSRVWVCVSPTAVAYHSSKTCAGLQRCTHAVVSTTKDSAVNYYHHRACKKCY